MYKVRKNNYSKGSNHIGCKKNVSFCLESTGICSIYAKYCVEDAEKITIKDMKKLLIIYTQNPNYVQFIADNNLVGAIDFRNGDKEKIIHQGFLGMIALPEYRNYGIGRTLLESLINWVEYQDLIIMVICLRCTLCN